MVTSFEIILTIAGMSLEFLATFLVMRKVFFLDFKKAKEREIDERIQSNIERLRNRRKEGIIVVALLVLGFALQVYAIILESL